MFGLLNVNKPSGVTSRTVVDHVQRLVKPVKVGHAGTLDPVASGVLVLCLGPATRLISYVQQMPKRYRATFVLGLASDTDDIEGKVTELEHAPRPSQQAIAEELTRWVGTVEQRPPIYSALKIRGRRAYDLARRGQQVPLGARRITIHQLELLRYDYPQIELDIHCGSGTYIRAIGRDVAQSLGTVAVMSALTRTAIGDFRVEDAHDVELLTRETIDRCRLPALAAVPGLPVVAVTVAEVARLQQGMPIENRAGLRSEELAATDPEGQLVALVTSRGNQLHPLRVLSHG